MNIGWEVKCSEVYCKKKIYCLIGIQGCASYKKPSLDRYIMDFFSGISLVNTTQCNACNNYIYRKVQLIKGNFGCWRELMLSCSKKWLNYKFYYNLASTRASSRDSLYKWSILCIPTVVMPHSFIAFRNSSLNSRSMASVMLLYLMTRTGTAYDLKLRSSSLIMNSSKWEATSLF